jgi:hypothetical protein
MAALAGLYIISWGCAGLLNLNLTDFDVFFLPSARIALAGHPLHVYALRYDFLYPNANGPLSLIPLTAVAALAAHLGWLDDPYLRRMLAMATFSVFSLLLAWEGVAAVDRLRKTPTRGLARLLVYVVFAASPVLWHGVLLYGHLELPITLWLDLSAVRLLAEERPGRAGLGLGLAILARSMAVIYLIPLTVLLVARRRWCAGAWLTGGTVATVGLGFLPFYLADRADVLYSLVQFRAALPIGGGAIWELAVGTSYEPLGQQADSLFVLGAALALSVVVVLVRRDLVPRDRDVYGLLAIAGISFPLLIKTLWPYYFLDGYLFLAIWWLGEPALWAGARRWLGAVLPAHFVVCSWFAEYGAELIDDPPARLRQSIATCLLLVGFTVAFGARVLLDGSKRTTLQAPESPVPAADGAAAQALGSWPRER